MKDKLKVIEYNLGILLMRIDQLNLSDKCDYEIINIINRMNEKLYEFSDLLEGVEIIQDDESIYPNNFIS